MFYSETVDSISIGAGSGAGAGAGAFCCSRFFASSSSFCFFFIAAFDNLTGCISAVVCVDSDTGSMVAIVGAMGAGSGTASSVGVGVGVEGGCTNAETFPSTIFGPTFLCPGILVKSCILFVPVFFEMCRS